ncbi:MAG: helix-turn-helix domain-containing protein [Deltaproteobacteria bacterium]|nr:helix-turn-helix domain-containing protein [Deltaproteobacteria bacterium]
MSPPNPDLQLAEDYVRHTDCNVFLTGKAGTGKTTFLQEVARTSPKRLVVTAPTGVAAINAGGVTLHSFFQLPFRPFVPRSEAFTGRHRMRREKKNLIRSLDLLIIDEISMVRADLLDGVDSVLRRYRRSDRPFGGVQLLMIGDLHQLSPVVKKEEWELLKNRYDSPYFFSSTALAREGMVPIELKRIYRQSDPRFIELLNRVRDNALDRPTLEELNARHVPGFSPADDEGYITLCTHNRSADAVNRARMKALPGKRRRFHADLEGEFPEQALPTPAVLELKKGAQVMFIRNDMSPDKLYFNGKIGTVTRLSGDAVEVRCPGDPAPIPVDRTTWENIDYSVDPKTGEISRQVVGTFTQVPLKPAWAITIHKSQGLTFDKAVIDAQAAFAYGQVYVALSRCRTLEGLVLSTPLAPSTVKTDPTVHRFVRETVHQPPSPQDLAAAKSRYQQRLLLEAFGFQELNRQLDRLTRLLRASAPLIQGTGHEELDRVRQQAFKEIVQVGERFKRQLQGMFDQCREPAGDLAIRERLGKAAGYFEERFKTILSPSIEGFSVETDNKEVREDVQDAARQLGQEAAVKLAGVLSCRDGFSPGRYLRALSVAAMEAEKPRAKAAPAYTEADVGHPELFEALRQWRKHKAQDEGVPPYRVLHQRTLVQIAVHLPDTLADLKRVRGIGKQLAARYGEELTALVADYRREHGIESVTLPEPAHPQPPKEKPKEDTKKITLEAFQQGLTIPRIAAERGLANATIEGHLAHFVARGELDIHDVVSEDKRRAIERQIETTRGRSLKKLKEALDDCTYGEIKLVLAHLEHLQEA